MPHFENDIVPEANYMNKKRCFSIYFYTFDDCHDCHHLGKCKEQETKIKKRDENKNGS